MKFLLFVYLLVLTIPLLTHSNEKLNISNYHHKEQVDPRIGQYFHNSQDLRYGKYVDFFKELSIDSNSKKVKTKKYKLVEYGEGILFLEEDSGTSKEASVPCKRLNPPEIAVDNTGTLYQKVYECADGRILSKEVEIGHPETQLIYTGLSYVMNGESFVAHVVQSCGPLQINMEIPSNLRDKFVQKTGQEEWGFLWSWDKLEVPIILDNGKLLVCENWVMESGYGATVFSKYTWLKTDDFIELISGDSSNSSLEIEVSQGARSIEGTPLADHDENSNTQSKAVDINQFRFYKKNKID